VEKSVQVAPVIELLQATFLWRQTADYRVAVVVKDRMCWVKSYRLFIWSKIHKNFLIASCLFCNCLKNSFEKMHPLPNLPFLAGCCLCVQVAPVIELLQATGCSCCLQLLCALHHIFCSLLSLRAGSASH
jgi:hypothetical protein